MSFALKKNWVAIILPTIVITNWLNTHRRRKEEEGKMHLKNLKPPLYYKINRRGPHDDMRYIDYKDALAKSGWSLEPHVQPKSRCCLR